jgi:hypothetical protein
MSGIYLFFGHSYAAVKDIAYEALLTTIKTIVTGSGLVEAAVAAVLSAAIGRRFCGPPPSAKSDPSDSGGEEAKELAQKQVSEFETAHKKRRRKYAAQRFFRLIVAAVITVVIVVGVYFAAENDLFGMAGDLIASSASNGGSLPMEFSGDATLSMFDWGGSVGILTDTAVYLYSTGGRELLYEQHGMTAPCAEASGRRMLIYDRGGTMLQVRTRTSVLFEQTYDYEIITASLSEDGYLTVVTGAQRYASR